MYSSRITLGALCAAILMLPACGPSYQRKALMPLCEKMAQYEETKNGVRLRARQMHKQEADTVFNGRGRYLFSSKNPIYPIHISVANNTAEPISCDPTKSNVPFADPKIVAQCLQHNTALKTAAILGIGTSILLVIGAGTGFFGFVIALGSYWGSVNPLAIIAFKACVATCAGILVLTPAASIYYGISWSDANKEITQDIRCKSAHCVTKDGIITIAPHQEATFILFADGKAFKPQFDVTVKNQDVPMIFNVDLEQEKNA